MIGNKYKLAGTTTVFQIMGKSDPYWIIKVYSEGNENLAVNGVLMTQQDMAESINTTKQLILI